jgi:ribosomal subunit interface protein
MRVTITARHCEISDDLRARARDLVERLGRKANRPHHAHVVFDADHGEPTAELQLHVTRGMLHVAKAAGTDHRTALDRAAGRVRRQIEKLERSAPVRRRRPSLPEARSSR